MLACAACFLPVEQLTVACQRYKITQTAPPLLLGHQALPMSLSLQQQMGMTAPVTAQVNACTRSSAGQPDLAIQPRCYVLLQGARSAGVCCDKTALYFLTNNVLPRMQQSTHKSGILCMQCDSRFMSRVD